jgi:uncharacterized membrane protein YeaQ/YmgE (transglycosylase-associated protein family)
MNITTWILAGGAIGWLGFSYLGYNAKRGVLISLLIGVAGGWVGGGVFAPLLGGIPVNSGDFNPLSLFVALATAMGCLAVSDMIYKRFGV